MKDVGCMETHSWIASRAAETRRLHSEGHRLTNHTLTDDGCKELLQLQVQLLQLKLLQALLLRLHRLHFLPLMARVIAPVRASRCICLKSQSALLLPVVMRYVYRHLVLCCMILVC